MSCILLAFKPLHVTPERVLMQAWTVLIYFYFFQWFPMRTFMHSSYFFYGVPCEHSCTRLIFSMVSHANIHALVLYFLWCPMRTFMHSSYIFYGVPCEHSCTLLIFSMVSHANIHALVLYLQWCPMLTFMHLSYISSYVSCEHLCTGLTFPVYAVLRIFAISPQSVQQVASQVLILSLWFAFPF
jgi:hypothetical protein